MAGVAMIDFWFRMAVVVIVIAVTYWFVETYPVTAALFLVSRLSA
jgi:hypothetical protein